MQKFIQLSIFEKAKSLPHKSVSVAAYRGEAHLLGFLYLALGLCIAGYIYFVGLSIMHLIVNREATAESERLQGTVATLEQEYFDLAKSVTPARAGEHGLSKPNETTFVRLPGGVASKATQGGL